MELIVFNMFLYFPLCSNPDKGFIVSAVRELGDVYPGVPKDYTGKVTFVMLNIVLMFLFHVWQNYILWQ